MAKSMPPPVKRLKSKSALCHACLAMDEDRYFAMGKLCVAKTISGRNGGEVRRGSLWI